MSHDLADADRAVASRTAYMQTLMSLHGVAELLLAGTQRRANRSIKLVVTDDGFATGPLRARRGGSLSAVPISSPATTGSCCRCTELSPTSLRMQESRVRRRPTRIPRRADASPATACTSTTRRPRICCGR